MGMFEVGFAWYITLDDSADSPAHRLLEEVMQRSLQSAMLHAGVAYAYSEMPVRVHPPPTDILFCCYHVPPVFHVWLISEGVFDDPLNNSIDAR